MSKGFFIGGFGSGGGQPSAPQGLVTVNNGQVAVSLPLDLYIDSSNNVFAGSATKNASLIYVNNNEIYARKVV